MACCDELNTSYFKQRAKRTNKTDLSWIRTLIDLKHKTNGLPKLKTTIKNKNETKNKFENNFETLSSRRTKAHAAKFFLSIKNHLRLYELKQSFREQPKLVL